MAPNSPIPLPHGELDLSTAEVRTTSGTHTLSDREVSLLQGLAKRPGQAIAPDELAAQMGIKTLSKSMLKNLVRRLRSKLEPDPRQPVVLVRQYGGRLQLNTATESGTVIRLVDGTLDCKRRSLERKGTSISLTDGQWELLGVLCSSLGTIHTTEDLRAVLGNVGSARIRQYISQLRQKIEVEPTNPVHLITDYGRGFLFVPHGGQGSALPSSEPDTTPLIGRDATLDDILSQLKQQRFLTLLGPAGLGKTRLAEAVAERAAAEASFPGGVVFCKLASSQSPWDALGVLAQRIGSPLKSGGDITAAAVELAQTLAHRATTLMVLDNLEQLVGTLDQWLNILIRLSPETRWVTTSRRRLGLPIEGLYNVKPLSIPAGIQLFHQRAVELEIPLPAAHEPLVERIVRAVEAVPLSILIAASRLNQLELLALCQALEDSLAALVDGDDRLERAIHWSWSLLSPDDQQVLAQLFIFRGGATLELAEQVIAIGEVWLEDVLMSLVDHSLLYMDHGTPEPRIHPYESVRAVLQTPPDDALIRRFIQAYEGLSVEAQGRKESLANHRNWTHRLMPEMDNLTAAQGLAQGRVVPEALLETFFWHRIGEGRLAEVNEVLRQWRARGTVTPMIRQEWLLSCLDLNLRDEAQAAAEALLNEPIEHTPTSWRNRATAMAIYVAQWKPKPIIEHMEAMLAEPGISDDKDWAWYQSRLGLAYQMSGEYTRAIECLQAAVNAPGAGMHQRRAMNNLSVALLQTGQVQDALPMLHQLYEQACEYGTQQEQLIQSIYLGRALWMSGQLSKGLPFLQQAWLKARTNPPGGLREDCGTAYGAACLAEQNPTLARQTLEETQSRCISRESARLAADTQSLLAALAALQGDPSTFDALWGRCTDDIVSYWALKPEDVDLLAQAYRAWAHGDPLPAREALKQPRLQLFRPAEKRLQGSAEYELHIMILRAWCEPPKKNVL